MGPINKTDKDVVIFLGECVLLIHRCIVGCTGLVPGALAHIWFCVFICLHYEILSNECRLIPLKGVYVRDEFHLENPSHF